MVQKRLVVWICAGNVLKCKYVRETAKSAISHPPHLIVASVLLIFIKMFNTFPIQYCYSELKERK